MGPVATLDAGAGGNLAAARPDPDPGGHIDAGRVTKPELRWLAAVVLVVQLLVGIPYWLAFGQAASGWVFTGMFWSPHDFTVYGAAMREGASSPSWLIHDHVTAEPHEPALIYPLYVALGKLAALLALDVQLAYLLAEVAARAVLLGSIYLFCSAIYHSVRERRLAFVLITFSSGLAVWLALLDGVLHFMGSQGSLFATELNLPEVNTFLVLFAPPHLMLGLAMLLLAARGYVLSWYGRGFWQPPWTGLAVLGVGIANPFSVATLCAAVGGHAALAFLRRRSAPRQVLFTAGAVFLVAAPFLTYYGVIFGTDPFWGLVFGRQNITLSPAPPYLALGLAPVLTLAVLGVRAFLRPSAPGRWLILTWIVVSLALMYAPFGFQRRFAFGLQPMLALVAASCLDPIWKSLYARRDTALPLGRRALRFGLPLALFASTLLFYRIIVLAAVHPVGAGGVVGMFQPRSVVDAVQWLANEMEPNDVVLADTVTSNYLAGVVPGRAFLGHWSATARYQEKEQAMRQFYRPQDGQQVKEGFLVDRDIRYVVYGPRELRLGPGLLQSDQIELLYSSDGVSIYELRSAVRPRK